MTKKISHNQFSLVSAKELCCAASNMVARFAEREPMKLETILAHVAGEANNYNDYCKLLSDLTTGVDDTELAKILRNFRMEQQVDLICRDVLGQISVEALLSSLSDLAKACVEITYQHVYSNQAKRYGVPLDAIGNQQHLVIFGMGKLGGNELNFSSDIDLILAYPQKGETQGDAEGNKVIDNELFFHRLAQKLIRLLDKYDDNGFVYRVDMRLKPFGSVGTLCTTFDSMRNYYLTHGRNWERYALVKMSPVAGDTSAGHELLKDLEAFVYQRHVDYEAVNSIESMKSSIVSNSKEKQLQDNIKLGQGGIREVEFLVQTFQMMYGGRMTELRGQSLLRALEALKEKELLNDKVANMLRSNYLRLRKIENAIQYYDDQQTHDLPNKAEPRKALLVALGNETWLQLMEEVTRIRYEVSQLFQRVFATQDDNASHADPEKLCEEYWLDLIYQTDITRDGAETIAKDLVRFYTRMKEHDCGERYLVRLNWVLPKIIAALDGEENPVKIAKHMLELLEAIVDESVYLSLLVEHPAVLNKIMHLFMHSEWMTRFLCEHPLVIDELIHENHEQVDPDDTQVKEELTYAISQCVDAETKLQKLMDFKNAMMFRTASADLQKKIRLMHVSDQLTWTAESIIEVVLAICLEEMTHKHGYPTYTINDKTFVAEFGVIAYGKLGGLEMGYNSDLDLVFLHSSQGENQITDGPKPIDNDVFFTRLVGKFNGYMTTMTPSGKLYEVDIRLRPSGQSGLLTHSLSAFEHYQQTEAWTWEHQALVRARFIAGGSSVRNGFNKIRQAVLEQDRNPEKLKESVLDMRTKMRQSFQRPEAGMIHVKHGRGGVTDIEFIVQYLLLKHTKEHRHLIRCSDNMRQLSALEVFGVLRSADASDLRSAYRHFRFWTHHQQLLGKRAVAPTKQFERQMEDVKRIWNKIFDV